MPNDAKQGMIVGVGLVIAIAVALFHRDAISGQAAPVGPSATAVNSPASPPAPGSLRGLTRAVQARTAVRDDKGPVEGRRHIVAEGDTLFSLAQYYYHDESKFVEIYRFNREVLKSPDALTPGLELIIPNLP